MSLEHSQCSTQYWNIPILLDTSVLEDSSYDYEYLECSWRPCIKLFTAMHNLYPCAYNLWHHYSDITTIRARKRSPGEISPAHIGAHWYYQHSGEQPQLERRILLEPSIVKGKGRPKGSKNKLQQKVKSYGVSSTRRDPSLYVCEALF